MTSAGPRPDGPLPQPGARVTSRKLKLDGAVHAHEAEVVRVDAVGLWLFSPAGTVVRDGEGRPRPDRTQVADGVLLYPARPLPVSGGWFCAWHWAPADVPPSEHWERPWTSVDVAARAGTTAFVDHEIDLWSSATDAGIVDEDELDAAEEDGSLDPVAAATARGAAAELYATLRQGCRSAFDGVGWGLLERCRARRG